MALRNIIAAVITSYFRIVIFKYYNRCTKIHVRAETGDEHVMKQLKPHSVFLYQVSERQKKRFQSSEVSFLTRCVRCGRFHRKRTLLVESLNLTLFSSFHLLHFCMFSSIFTSWALKVR